MNIYPDNVITKNILANERNDSNIPIHDPRALFQGWHVAWRSNHKSEFMREVNYLFAPLAVTMAIPAVEIIAPTIIEASIQSGMMQNAIRILTPKEMALNTTANFLGQYMTNGHKFTEIDVVDLGAASFRGWAPSLTGSLVNLSIGDRELSYNGTSTVLVQFGLGHVNSKISDIRISPKLFSNTQIDLFGFYLNSFSQIISSGITKTIKDNEEFKETVPR